MGYIVVLNPCFVVLIASALQKKVNKTEAKGVNTKKANDRPNFADFRKKLLEQQLNQENEIITAKAVSDPEKTKTFDGGFFKIDSPIRKVVETGSGDSLIRSY